MTQILVNKKIKVQQGEEDYKKRIKFNFQI